MSMPNKATEPMSILKHTLSNQTQQSTLSTRFVLSDEEDEDGLKYTSDGDNDDDEPNIEPMSAEALELLKTEKVLKAGYLLKKGEKRRTWKKRWFVLRTTKLAMYKDKKEYKLLRIIDLHEIHKVVQMRTKHKYKYVFAFVTAKRVYYVQADDQQDMDDWFRLVNQAKEDQRLYDADDDTSSMDRDQEFAKDVITSYKSNHIIQNQRRQSSGGGVGGTYDSDLTTKPVDIPQKKPTGPLSEYSVGYTYPLSPSSDQTNQMSVIDGIASSEDDEEYGTADKLNVESEGSKNRVLIEGYLLKLGRNKGWRKRWFVLRPETLSYYEDEKEYSPHRIIPLHHIIDSLEIDPVSKSKQHCFKIIIPKRSYVLCASTENDMDSWLNALVVAIGRAKKEFADESKPSTPSTPQPQHQYQTVRQLSLIPESCNNNNNNNITTAATTATAATTNITTTYGVQKVQSTHSSADSFENISHISGVSGAGGVGGAGGALGATPTSTGLIQLHSRASERLGRAK
ncbi:hypothetical protein HPULCUR_003986 [Helicostylum pulchrum]|uniref:PH domain-containing protein n=1 Tax=Helicostylum pulchrum TaxID=562976 RepID=A0ABP9XV42_9FUNG